MHCPAFVLSVSLWSTQARAGWVGWGLVGWVRVPAVTPHILHRAGKVRAKKAHQGGEARTELLKPATPLGNDRLVCVGLLNTAGVKIQGDVVCGVYSTTKLANFGLLCLLPSLCHLSHNQRTTTFRHPVTGQISPENVDYFLQEQ